MKPPLGKTWRRIRSRRRLAALGTVALALAACGQRPAESPIAAPPEEASIVARIGDEPIGVEDLVETGPLRGETDRGRRLDAVITRRLSAEEARRRGLADADAVREQIETIRRDARAREEALLRDRLFRQIRDGLEIPEAELWEHYEQTKSRYFERQLHLRRADFPSREDAEAAEAALGAEGRLDPEASEEIGPAPLAELPRDLLSEALRLKAPGERALVEGKGSWSLVELVELLPAVPKPFEEVGERVDKSLRTLRGQEAFRRLLDELRADVEIEIHDDVLADDSLWPRQARDPAGRAQRGAARP